MSTIIDGRRHCCASKEVGGKMLTVDRVDTIAGRIQKVYLVFVCLLAPFLIISLIAGKYSLEENLQGALNLLIDSLIFYGLLRKKHWVVVLALIFPALWLLSASATILAPASDFRTLLQKFAALGLFVFYAYQINFFSKHEVKQFYGVKGFIIF